MDNRKYRFRRNDSRFRAAVKYGNPSYPMYVLLNEHGCIAAELDGASFTAAAARATFNHLVSTCFTPGAKIEYTAAWNNIDALDTFDEDGNR